MIHTAEGDIQVLHATPEQLAEIQQLHQIQICGDQIITSNCINTSVAIENLSNVEPNVSPDVSDCQIKPE